VGNGHSVAGCIGLLLGACVREARLLLHRQGIHVGTHQDRWTVAIAQDADDAGTADLVVHLEAGLSQRVGRARRSLHFLVRQLWMPMQVLVGVLLPLLQGVLPSKDASGGLRD
jgi:hypothetical protein